MKFGSVAVHELDHIDFTLPADTPGTQRLWSTLPTGSHPPALYIGSSVWTDPSLRGHVYPQGTPAKQFLAVYCQQFNTVELNATFYGTPTITQVQRWRDTATAGFMFCPKVPRSISHSRPTDRQRVLLDTFIDTILHFDQTLGITFLQLPPYFQPSSLPVLAQLLAHFPQGFALAVEFRHPAWFMDSVALQEGFALLQQHNAVAVISDVAGRRDVLHQTLTTGCAFIRFVGYDLHATDYLRVDAWVARLMYWLSQGLERVYFFIHQPHKARAADLVWYMIQQLNAQTSLQLQPPRLVHRPCTLF